MNPWKDISMGKEFLYDLKHPVLFHRRAVLGIKGQNPEVTGLLRVVSIGLIIEGFLLFTFGLFLVLHGSPHTAQ